MSNWKHHYRVAFTHCTRKLLAICLFLSIGTLIFGYDTSSFSGVQAIPAFVSQFGEEVEGMKILLPVRLSLINSLAFVGKCESVGYG